jgi:hypothetical protein
MLENPVNDDKNQFLLKEPYLFTSGSFDSDLAKGKISREEVEIMVDKIND